MDVAIDLDGTLAYYDGYKGDNHIGDPIPSMVRVLNTHIEKGDTVSIFTARVSDPKTEKVARKHIVNWIAKHDLPFMDITAIKHKKFKLFYDDRSIAVVRNRGVESNARR